jgi:hypothetical protein
MSSIYNNRKVELKPTDGEGMMSYTLIIRRLMGSVEQHSTFERKQKTVYTTLEMGMKSKLLILLDLHCPTGIQLPAPI